MRKFHGPFLPLYHRPFVAVYCSHECAEDGRQACACYYCDYCGDYVEGCAHSLPAFREREDRELEELGISL